MSAAGGSVLRAGALAGMVGVLLVATPIVNALNYCCCVLVVLTGVFAAWVMRSDSSGRASTGAMALAGTLAGAITGLVGTPAAALFSRLANGEAQLEQMVEEALEAARKTADSLGQPVLPGMLEGMEAGMRATTGLEFNGWLVVTAIFAAMAYAFFGMLGSLGFAMSTRRSAAGPPPTVPPAAPPVPPARDLGVELPGEAGSEPPAAASTMPVVSEVEAASPPADSAAPREAGGSVTWDGPVLRGSEGPPATAGDAEDSADVAETGDQFGAIPLDELPELPPRPPRPADPDEKPPA